MGCKRSSAVACAAVTAPEAVARASAAAASSLAAWATDSGFILCSRFLAHRSIGGLREDVALVGVALELDLCLDLCRGVLRALLVLTLEVARPLAHPLGCQSERSCPGNRRREWEGGAVSRTAPALG
eukprot:1941381-Alexandrium_andersonii.AAC.1